MYETKADKKHFKKKPSNVPTFSTAKTNPDLPRPKNKQRQIVSLPKYPYNIPSIPSRSHIIIFQSYRCLCDLFDWNRLRACVEFMSNLSYL